MLRSKVDTANMLLGFDTDDDLFQVDGTIALDYAYGGVSVVQMVGTSGGERDLSTRGTKNEAKIYLNGLIKGLDMARNRA